MRNICLSNKAKPASQIQLTPFPPLLLMNVQQESLPSAQFLKYTRYTCIAYCSSFRADAITVKNIELLLLIIYLYESYQFRLGNFSNRLTAAEFYIAFRRSRKTGTFSAPLHEMDLAPTQPKQIFFS